MAYSIEENASGRFVVISPKGRKWKTTYATRAAAEKGVSYVEGRFGGSGSSAREEESAMTERMLPRQVEGQMDDPPILTGERGEKTLLRMRSQQDEGGF